MLSVWLRDHTCAAACYAAKLDPPLSIRDPSAVAQLSHGGCRAGCASQERGRDDVGAAVHQVLRGQAAHAVPPEGQRPRRTAAALHQLHEGELTAAIIAFCYPSN